MVISFIANAVSGAVVIERAFHYKDDEFTVRGTVVLLPRCEAYNCILLQIFSVRLYG